MLNLNTTNCLLCVCRFSALSGFAGSLVKCFSNRGGGGQRKRSMKGTNINSSVLISLSTNNSCKVILQSRQAAPMPPLSHWKLTRFNRVAHISVPPSPPTYPASAPVSITGMKWQVASTECLTSVI